MPERVAMIRGFLGRTRQKRTRQGNMECIMYNLMILSTISVNHFSLRSSLVTRELKRIIGV
jgi:hypothetical protein